MQTEPPVLDHFGERIRRGKYGYRLSRDTYAIINKRSSTYIPRELMKPQDWEDLAWAYDDEDHRIFSDEYCERNRARALANFDLNMAFFSQIAPSDFEAALTEMLSRSLVLKPVTDLRRFDGVEGLYVMVLDGCRQAYIGQATDIRRRIKQHWSGTKQFDRLLFGTTHESVLSIDVFRALDTTRIYAARTINADSLERKAVSAFPADFLLNRINGGLVTGFRATLIAAEMKRRQLAAD